MTGIANINPETGIAYGYISANALEHDVVCALIDGGVDAHADAAFAAWLKEKISQIQAANEDISDEDAKAHAENLSHEFWDEYRNDEPIAEGEYEGVKYCSSWLGGALNFFIFASPVTTTKARLASPCVPNAGILDTLDGNVTAYDVPAEWRREAHE